MKTKITYKDISEFNPCYDPSEIGMSKGYSATILEFIDEFEGKVKNKEDIIWLLARKEYMTDQAMRLFAVWCTRKTLKLVKNPDERSINVCNVAESYANGQATKEDLVASRNIAREAPAGAAVWDVAIDSAMNSARYAAWDFARVATWYAAWDAAWAAKNTVWNVVWAAQLRQLKTYFK